jgi:L-amino acid N-acyltransferase YncA
MSSIEYRVATVADAAAVANVYAPYVRDTAITFETEVPDAGEIEERIQRIGAQYPWLVAVAGSDIAGYAYACENRSRAAYRWSVDAAVYLRADVRRTGIGRALYERLFALLRAQGFVNAFAGITLPNAASIGLHHQLGFRMVGVHRAVGYKLGAWHDVGWWHLTMGRPLPSDPPEPTPFHQLDRAWVARVLAHGTAPAAGLEHPRRAAPKLNGPT